MILESTHRFQWNGYQSSIYLESFYYQIKVYSVHRDKTNFTCLVVKKYSGNILLMYINTIYWSLLFLTASSKMKYLCL